MLSRRARAPAPPTPPTSMADCGSEATRSGRRRGLDSLRERLGEREVRVERSSRQARCPIHLAAVGHPFVDQDQARADVFEKPYQVVGTGGCATGIRL